MHFGLFSGYCRPTIDTTTGVCVKIWWIYSFFSFFLFRSTISLSIPSDKFKMHTCFIGFSNHYSLIVHVAKNKTNKLKENKMGKGNSEAFVQKTKPHTKTYIYIPEKKAIRVHWYLRAGVHSHCTCRKMVLQMCTISSHVSITTWISQCNNSNLI